MAFQVLGRIDPTSFHYKQFLLKKELSAVPRQTVSAVTNLKIDNRCRYRLQPFVVAQHARSTVDRLDGLNIEHLLFESSDEIFLVDFGPHFILDLKLYYVESRSAVIVSQM